MLALTVGVVLVLSANNPSATQVTTPSFVNASANHSINITVSNPAGSAELKGVRIVKPSSFSTLDCGVRLPAGWSCDDGATSEAKFTISENGIAAGTSVSFMINGIAPSTTGNVSFDVNTFEDSSAISGFNYTIKANVTVDADAPVIYNNSMNLSDGNVTMLNASTLAHGTGWVKLQDLTFNITITDVFDNLINASIYYRNTTTLGEIPATPPHPDNASSYNDTVRLTSKDSATGRYNGTIPASLLNNGTKIFFTIVANDSVSNRNVTSLTVLSTNTYNFSVDGAPPLLSVAPNMITEFDAGEDNIITSTVVVNFTLNVTDDGGSGVSRVEINASATQGWVNMTQNGTLPAWYFSGSLSQLGVAAGDGNLTIHFRAFDNVSNVNGSIATLNVLVDDDAPQFAIGLFSPSNTTDQTRLQNFTKSNSSVLNFSILIYGNLNYTGGIYANSTVATIMGPDGRVYNLSLLSKTSTWTGVGNANQMVYSSRWYSAQSPQSDGEPGNSLNSTNSTLNTLGCATLNPDGGVCPILINVTDIFGRSNSTNISITLDNVSAAVSNISINATGGAVQVVRSGSVINFSVNANNNILNVTIHNASKDAERLNATLLTAMGGTGNYSIALGANLVCGGGVEGICTVNFSTVDKALNINRSGILNAKAQGASITFIVDDSAPLVSNFMIAGMGSYLNQTGSGGNMTLRSDLDVAITFNVSDQVTNVTQVRIGNATVRNASFATADIPDGFANTSTLADFGCPTNVEGVTCILTVAAYDNETIDGLKNSNTTVNLTVTVDDLKPRVFNFSTNLVNGNGRNVTSVNTVINFSVNITESNLPDKNVSIMSTVSIKMNKTGSFNVNSSGASNSSATTWWAMASINDLGCTSDGDCTITVVANDSAGNVNSSVSIIVAADSTVLNIINTTYNAVFLFDSTPTLHVNTSKAALCRYSTTAAPGTISAGYSHMSTQFDSEGTTANSFTLPSTADGSYEYAVSCVDVAGVGEKNSTVKFTIDTLNASVIAIDNSTQNVVFYFDNTPTITVNLTENALCRYSSTGGNNYTTMTSPFTVNGTRHNSFTLGTTADGSYTYPVACATANEQNVVTGTVAFTVDTINDTTIAISNLTDTGSTFIDATPTVHVNLSANALCRYSGAGGTYVFSDMTSPFGVNGTRHNSFTITGDLRDDNYAYPVACTTANGQNNVTGTVRFAVDTTSLWNVTIGKNGYNGGTGSGTYFTESNKFYSFQMDNAILVSDASYLSGTTVNVSNVLASILSANPSGSSNNLTIMYALNATSGTVTSYVPGRATGNTLNNFTANGLTYYANFSVANERVEVT